MNRRSFIGLMAGAVAAPCLINQVDNKNITVEHGKVHSVDLRIKDGYIWCIGDDGQWYRFSCAENTIIGGEC